ncbi:MAG: hypothetical protein F6K40_09475 [Okeania sp. SIO3I5]|uniref:hypothetical protein n=1 Tax=Okeania sp. SIO3I5 TaxID=2607805 RepID=UPI0013BA8565|nr:hypothetical protein [Okeania sp. SIO3I5]NEQ36493.1 hypothetical protein [Okeania sp. SIO3I5]
MTTETSPKTELLTEVAPDREAPMPPTDLIFDDGEPLKSNRHFSYQLSVISYQYLNGIGRLEIGNILFFYPLKRGGLRPKFFGHRIAMNILIDSLYQYWSDCN